MKRIVMLVLFLCFMFTSALASECVTFRFHDQDFIRVTNAFSRASYRAIFKLTGKFWQGGKEFRGRTAEYRSQEFRKYLTTINNTKTTIFDVETHTLDYILFIKNESCIDKMD